MYYYSTTITAFLALSARQIEAQVVLATNCYYKSDSQVQQGNAGPCGVVTPTTNFTSCCVPGDTCLANGICHYSHAMPAAPFVETGYYLGGCTDPTFSAATCSPSCSNLHLPDVVYNQTTNLWHCCGLINGAVRCDTPTDQTFTAPAPSALSATFSVGPTPITAASSPSSTSTTTTTPSPSTSQGPGVLALDQGLSTGAKAGIGVVCAVVGVAIIGLLAWFFARRRNGHAEQLQSPAYTDYNHEMGGYKADGYKSNGYKEDVPMELPSQPPQKKVRNSTLAELG